MTRHPNILFIMSDQHRGDCLNFVPPIGRTLAVQTPHLRRLATEGVCFTKLHSESPVCVPARAILQTGISPFRSGIYDNQHTLPEDHPTLAGCLSASGYFTQAIGKMHFRPARAAHGLQRLWLSEAAPRLGEDDYLQFVLDGGYGHVEEPMGIAHEMICMPQVNPLPETHHNTAWVGRKTVQFLREHVRERPRQPFFCWTSFVKPHVPFDPPAPWHRLYVPAEAPPPLKSNDELAWLPTSMRLSAHQMWLDDYPDANRLAAMWTYYFASISFIDAWMGMILDELERLGLREDTLVVYTSDHGDHMGDHSAWVKSSFYDSAARVPGIISWPGHLPQGAVRTQLAGLTDIVPTLLAATEIDPAPFGLQPDGVSLLPVVRDDVPTRDVLFGLVGSRASTGGAGDAGSQLAAITTDWKYIYAAGDNRELLFRRASERDELHNELATGDPTARAAAAELRRAVQAQCRAGGATDFLDDSPTGFRLRPAWNYPQMLASDPALRDRWRLHHFQRWYREMPEGWTPPPPAPNGGIPADLPQRADRSRYRWPTQPA